MHSHRISPPPINLIKKENFPFFEFLGSHNGNHSCDCHFTEDGCAEEALQSNTCNCDANLPVQLKDTGFA